MIGLLQRVSHASVVVDGVTVGAIEGGLMVLLVPQFTPAAAPADGWRLFD